MLLQDKKGCHSIEVLVDNVGEDSAEQAIGRTTIPVLRNYIVPFAICVGADLLEFGVLEIEDVTSGRKSLKTVANSMGRQTLRK